MRTDLIIGILLLVIGLGGLIYMSSIEETSIEPCVDGDGDPVVSEDLMCEKTVSKISSELRAAIIITAFVGLMLFVFGMLSHDL